LRTLTEENLPPKPIDKENGQNISRQRREVNEEIIAKYTNIRRFTARRVRTSNAAIARCLTDGTVEFGGFRAREELGKPETQAVVTEQRFF